MGAVLAQRKDGIERPVAYFSRKLQDAQTRYSVSEKECLAVVLAVCHFEAYLYGAKFTVVTDHRAFTSLQNLTAGGARLVKWALALQQFDYEVRHRPGAQHLHADGLSRQAWVEQQQIPKVNNIHLRRLKCGQGSVKPWTTRTEPMASPVMPVASVRLVELVAVWHKASIIAG